MIPNSTTGQASGQAAKSLPEVYASIAVPRGGSVWRRMFAFFGPGYLVAVGYMDPGNWATALAGGASFGFILLSVALLSNIMAIILQSLCARLGIGAGRDLAQACRDYFPKPVAFILWVLAEAAIIATDLAEVIGTAIGLNLLFNIPMEIGVIVTALDVFLILMLQRLGFRWIEAFIISLSVVITACFAVQLALAQPEFAAVMGGFVPRTDIITDPKMLYLALGILGATVMPHNLYLHSAIVQTRAVGNTNDEKRSAIRFATIDSTIALLFALFTNASILILSAAAFHHSGHVEITDLREAHTLLSPLLGTSLAATLFAVALLCCGLNSTVTATMAGQVVMEGFINFKLPPWMRRLVTRMIAILPAIFVLMIWGESKTGDLLVLSQVILSLQLPFAIIPLVLFTASKKRMGELVAPRGLSLVAALIAVVIVALNVKMLVDVIF